METNTRENGQALIGSLIVINLLAFTIGYIYLKKVHDVSYSEVKKILLTR